MAMADAGSASESLTRTASIDSFQEASCCPAMKVSDGKQLERADKPQLSTIDDLPATTSTSCSTTTDAVELHRREEGAEEACKPVTVWALAYVVGVLLSFITLLTLLYLTLPSFDRTRLKLPRSIDDLRSLKDYLSLYTKDHMVHVALCYSTLYVTLQTFAFPGTPLLSVLAGSLFGGTIGLPLVACTATLGASSCYFMAQAVGRPLVRWLWPRQMRIFSAEVAKRRDKLWNYMIFMRVTPALPNAFVNIASPLVDVPFSVFAPATFIGLLPGTFVQVRTGLTLGELKSLRDLGDTKSTVTLIFIGVVSLVPILVNKSKKD